MLARRSKLLRRALPAVLIVLAALAAPLPASAAGSGTAAALEDGLGGLVGALSPPPSSAGARARIHAIKREVIAGAFSDQVAGVRAATVIDDFDCISLNVQRARRTTTARVMRVRIAAARACRADLARAATAAGAGGLAADLQAVGRGLTAIAAGLAAGRGFGAKATALRSPQARVVARRFAGATLHGIPFGDVYADLACVDVKVEGGRTSGAAACARRLLRRARALAPAQEPVTFGSDLTGTPVALPAAFAPDDTEFWTSALTVPADGRITTFRLRTGDSPVGLPLRFSIVRPAGGGTVTVVTTTDPVYPLEAHDPGVHTYATSSLRFACCAVRKGDIVTVDNSGTTTPRAYVWFAERPETTTFSHTAGGDSQNAGAVWTPLAHPGYDTLVQAVLQPG